MGTDELRLHKLRLVAGGDPALSEYPLGILLAREVIDQDQHNAGDRYGWLYAKSIGRTKALGYDTFGGTDLAEDELRKIERHAVACQAALRRMGGHVLRITEEVCCYRHLRPWLVPDGRTTAGQDDRARLLTGLDTLVALIVGRR